LYNRAPLIIGRQKPGFGDSHVILTIKIKNRISLKYS
jgi:hypothetical protein